MAGLIRQAGDASGAYEWAEEPKGRLSRFTVFVRYTYMDEEDTEALAETWSSVEEIDVNATSHADAQAIAQAALDRDYEPGGIVIDTQERFGWYL